MKKIKKLPPKFIGLSTSENEINIDRGMGDGDTLEDAMKETNWLLSNDDETVAIYQLVGIASITTHLQRISK
jgi:hypothetical protein